MSRERQPTDLLLLKGRKHLSRAEEADRRSMEVNAPPAKAAKPPKWLPETLKKEFRSLGKKLISLGIYSDLDADALGRYLVAHHQWLIATGEVEKALTASDPSLLSSGQNIRRPNLTQAEAWGGVQDMYFKQARTCANDLGLTVTSRCRLVLPKREPEENAFEAMMRERMQRA